MNSAIQRNFFNHSLYDIWKTDTVDKEFLEQIIDTFYVSRVRLTYSHWKNETLTDKIRTKPLHQRMWLISLRYYQNKPNWEYSLLGKIQNIWNEINLSIQKKILLLLKTCIIVEFKDTEYSLIPNQTETYSVNNDDIYSLVEELISMFST